MRERAVRINSVGSGLAEEDLRVVVCFFVCGNFWIYTEVYTGVDSGADWNNWELWE